MSKTLRRKNKRTSSKNRKNNNSTKKMKGGNPIGLALASLLLTTLIYSLQKNNVSDIANSLQLKNDGITITNNNNINEITEGIKNINIKAGTNFEVEGTNIELLDDNKNCDLQAKLIEIIRANQSCSK